MSDFRPDPRISDAYKEQIDQVAALAQRSHFGMEIFFAKGDEQKLLEIANREFERRRELEDAISQLRRAIEQEGLYPAHHRREMRSLRERWPVLFGAIARVISA